ncbi:MAG TPA: hypothetical protein VIW92_09540 [Thermoanaerobaculia bacterium]
MNGSSLRYLRLAVPMALLVLAVFAGPAAPEASACSYYGYIDEYYTDSTYSVPCGSYNSCTRTYSGCRTSYRLTETTICYCRSF